MSLPQREGRPALSIKPEEAIPSTAGWCERYDDPANECNKPVPLRKGGPEESPWEDDYVKAEINSSTKGYSKTSDDEQE